MHNGDNSSSALIHPSTNWDVKSLKSQDEVELEDARALGLLSSTTFGSRATLPAHFDSQLSTFKDPFHALVIIMHRLSNNAPTGDILGIMDQFAHSASDPLLEVIFGLGYPAARAAWPGLLNWVERIDKRSLFQCFARGVLQDPRLLKQKMASEKLLILAARYGCDEICNGLIQHGISPNAEEYISSLNWFKTSPLLEAAKGGNAKTAKILLQGGADANIRYGGLTTAGHLLLHLRRSTLHRVACLEVMKLLLEHGLDVSAPFSPNDDSMTLLDEALLNNDDDVVKIFRELPCADPRPGSPITVSGIIPYAKKGTQELQSYLRASSLTLASRRRRIQIVRWTGLPAEAELKLS